LDLSKESATKTTMVSDGTFAAQAFTFVGYTPPLTFLLGGNHGWLIWLVALAAAS
jgi:hypothetical protein